ncbi:helix-turn-helix domain-containing protein [Paenibacillus sp. MBLB4367]|uniref:helix-turn-helix domain-containing protein n=1 Tax=Paenibacillus sp. MBLB4367 TaxID=3384767 RepID=UPI003908052A
MKWPHTVQKRHFYYKVIIIALILSLLPMLATSIVYYQNVKATVQQELREANGNYLNQTANAMEMMIDQIGSSFRQLTLEGTTMRQFELFPRGSYYEMLTGELKDEDLPALESYLHGKKQALSNMRALKLSNDFINSVYYYDSVKKLILTSDLLVYEPDRFYDEGWNRFSRSDPALPMILDMRSAKTAEGSFLNVIPLVYKTSIEGNVLVINLDADKIYESFVRRTGSEADRPFFVMSSGGKPMLYDSANPMNVRIGENPIWQKQNRGEQSFFEEGVEGERLFVTWVKSERLGWTFVFATPLGELYGSVAKVKSMIVLYCCVLAAAACLLALLLARNLYAPIRRMLQFIKSTDDRYAGATTGEWHVIRSSLEDAFEDRWSLRHRLKESLPAYKETFVRSLLRPHSFERDYLIERLDYLGFDIELEQLLLMVVSLERTDGQPADAESESLNKVLITDSIGAGLPATWKRMVSEIADGTFVVIVNGQPRELSELFACAEQLIRTIGERPGIGCSIGIGKPCAYAGELDRAYAEAIEALRYRGIFGTGQVIYIEDVRLEGTAALHYPSDKEEALNTYIVNGDTEQALHILDLIVRDIGGEKGRLHVRQIQYALMRLLGSLVATSGRMSIDFSALTGEKNNLYEALLHKDDLQEAVQWLRRLIMTLASGFGTAFREKNNRYVVQAVAIIRSELDKPLSLVQIADRLRLNPSYLSRIFKENIGQSFSDYLTKVRMEKGKELLLETDLKIKEIGERVGYIKSDYFIKLFRECIGMTPGEYRKARSGM